MQHSSALPYELRHFKTYKKAMDHNRDYIANIEAAKNSLNTKGAISTSFNTFATAAEEANKKAIQQLSTYGRKFLETYVESRLHETEESLNMLMGLKTQYDHRDIRHIEERDWEKYTTIKNNVATLTIGIKANSSLRTQESHSTENTSSFDELHQLIKQMWTNYSNLLKLADRFSKLNAGIEDWLSKHNNNP